MKRATLPGGVAELWDQQGGCCFHCHEPMLRNVSKNHGLTWSRDHLMPRAIGGGNSGNVVLAHRSCNSARGHTPPTDNDIERARIIYAALGWAFLSDGSALDTFAPQPLGTFGDLWPGQAS